MLKLAIPTVLPDRCSLHVVAVSDPERYKNRVTFWNEVYEFKMAPMKEKLFFEPDITVVDESKIVSDPALLKVPCIGVYNLPAFGGVWAGDRIPIDCRALIQLVECACHPSAGHGLLHHLGRGARIRYRL